VHKTIHNFCGEMFGHLTIGKASVKGKTNLSLYLTKHHAMKIYWGSGGTAPRILWPRH
jgi:hypothetical protein